MKDAKAMLDMKSPRELIEDLATHLSWKQGTALLWEASRPHLFWLHARLRMWERVSGVGLYRRMQSLPAASRQRFLLAPRLFYLLYTNDLPDEAAVAAVSRYLQIEELLWAGAGPLDSPGWSALEDAQLVPTPGSQGFHVCNQAPLAKKIVLDCQGPHGSLLAPESWGNIRGYTEEEMAFFQVRVEDALALIEGTSVTALETITASVRVITGVSTLRPLGKTEFGASSLAMIGRMALPDAHSGALAPGKLADMILHEAIHSLIYKLELVAPLYVDYEESLKVRSISPWSGRSLSLRSFVHACFVWYGLWSFWSLNCDGVGDTHRDLAKRGYSDRSPLGAITQEARDLIQPYVCTAIESMHRSVQAAAPVLTS